MHEYRQKRLKEEADGCSEKDNKITKTRKNRKKADATCIRRRMRDNTSSPYSNQHHDVLNIPNQLPPSILNPSLSSHHRCKSAHGRLGLPLLAVGEAG